METRTSGYWPARWLSAAAMLACFGVASGSEVEVTIARIKPSVVAVGTFERTRSPQFQFRGTGFVVGDGTLVATNAHVLPGTLNTESSEQIAILLPAKSAEEGARASVYVRAAKPVARDVGHDIAVLKIEGAPLAPLALGESSSVREGRNVYFTGFPIGSVLGAHPATHRALVAAIAPIAIPQGNASQLNAATLRRIAAGTFPVFQLDGIAYPGNSGSPVYEAGNGSVIGVINMVLARATKESLLSQPSGITYAIPVEHLRALLETLR